MAPDRDRPINIDTRPASPEHRLIALILLWPARGVRLLLAVVRVGRAVLIGRDRSVRSFRADRVPPPRPVDHPAPSILPDP
jgi:hypothetical protein